MGVLHRMLEVIMLGSFQVVRRDARQLRLLLFRRRTYRVDGDLLLHYHLQPLPARQMDRLNMRFCRTSSRVCSARRIGLVEILRRSRHLRSRLLLRARAIRMGVLHSGFSKYIYFLYLHMRLSTLECKIMVEIPRISVP